MAYVLGERVESWVREHELAVDAAVAGVLLGGCVLFELIAGGGGFSFFLTLLLVLPLVARRRNPVACAAVVLPGALLQWVTVRDSVGALPADLAVPMAIYALSAYGPLWASRVGLGAGLAGAVLGGFAWPRLASGPSAHVLFGALIASTVVAAWAFGTLHRVRREQTAVRDRLAVLAERNRIAREMHDVVAHSLAVLIAQADGGRYAGTPEAAGAALTTIGDYARQALGETRRILGVLRDDPSSADPPAPQPGLDDLPRLVDQVRAGGLAVELTLPAPSHPIEPGLALTAYRIVQEGLTNVMKHAGPNARADVTLRWTDRELELSIVDYPQERASVGIGEPASVGTGEPESVGIGEPESVGTGEPADGDVGESADGRRRRRVGGEAPGFGLIGMRERVTAYGGTVVSGPRAGGGWSLAARIPW